MMAKRRFEAVTVDLADSGHQIVHIGFALIKCGNVSAVPAAAGLPARHMTAKPVSGHHMLPLNAGSPFSLLPGRKAAAVPLWFESGLSFAFTLFNKVIAIGIECDQMIMVNLLLKQLF